MNHGSWPPTRRLQTGRNDHDVLAAAALVSMVSSPVFAQASCADPANVSTMGARCVWSKSTKRSSACWCATGCFATASVTDMRSPAPSCVCCASVTSHRAQIHFHLVHMDKKICPHLYLVYIRHGSRAHRVISLLSALPSPRRKHLMTLRVSAWMSASVGCKTREGSPTQRNGTRRAVTGTRCLNSAG